MKDIKWSNYAKRSLQECIDFMIDNWGNDLKEDLINTVDKRLEQVSLNPYLAPPLPSTEFRRLLIHKNLTLFYIVLPDTIKVVLAWDSRQDPKLLEKRLTK